jgi:hypothetical protein
LSSGDQFIGDIEKDIAPGCGLSLVIACLAHSFSYDESSGYCLSDPISGGIAQRWDARIDGNDVFIGELLPVCAQPLVSKNLNNIIQLAIVSQALDRKYGPDE